MNWVVSHYKKLKFYIYYLNLGCSLLNNPSLAVRRSRDFGAANRTDPVYVQPLVNASGMI